MPNQAPPDTQNYAVGGVIIVLGGLDLGVISGFGIDPSDIEVLEHFSARTGARKVDKQIIVQKRLKFRATLDEHQYQLYAKYFMGDTDGTNKVLPLTNPLAETNGVITYLNEDGEIWTYSHSRIVARPAAAMDFGDFSDWIRYEMELEALSDENATPVGGIVPTHGIFTFSP